MSHFGGAGKLALVIHNDMDEDHGGAENCMGDGTEYAIHIQGEDYSAWYPRELLTLVKRQPHDPLKWWRGLVKELDAVSGEKR